MKGVRAMKTLYIVTGAYGHLGNVVVRLLAKRGEWVRGLALPGDPAVSLPDGVEVIRGDICCPASLHPLFETEEPCRRVVIHAAGIVSIASKYQQKVWDVNVGGTANLLAFCRQYGVEKMVYVSSVHAIPERPEGQVVVETDHFDPDLVEGLYAKTKAEATALVLEAAKDGLPAVVVQPSGIVGPWDFGHGHLNALVADCARGKLLAGVEGGYDFVDVRDVAAGVIAAADRGRVGECYILANRYFTVQEFLERCHLATGCKPIRHTLPLWFARATAPLSEIYYKIRKAPPLYTRYSLYTLETNAVFSWQKAADELGYRPRPMEETLRDTVHFMRVQGRF